MAIGLAIASSIGTLTSIGMSIWSRYQAKEERDDAEERKRDLQDEITDLENNRQLLANPYAAMKNPYEDMSNQYANLRVATKAAEIQIQETDTALANTLDMLRLTGSSAGGATALAQAALKSKQGVAANLEQQEAQNDKLRAQGQMQVDQMKAQGEMQVQQLQAQGEMQMMTMRETRELQKLDRTQAMLDQERVTEAEAQQAMYAALGNIGSSAMSGVGNFQSALEYEP